MSQLQAMIHCSLTAILSTNEPVWNVLSYQGRIMEGASIRLKLGASSIFMEVVESYLPITKIHLGAIHKGFLHVSSDF